jgi:hypothetical protein
MLDIQTFPPRQDRDELPDPPDLEEEDQDEDPRRNWVAYEADLDWLNNAWLLEKRFKKF